MSGSFNFSAACFALSAVILGHTLQISNGFYHPEALRWLTGAFVFCLLGGAASRFNGTMSRTSAMVVAMILGAGLVWQMQQHFISRPGIYISAQANLGTFKTAVVVQGVCIAVGLLNIRVLRRIWFPATLAASLLVGIWMIKASPEPLIDVIVVHKEAIDALVHRKDPYRITFENIYESAETRKFYNPDVLIGGRLAQAYPYPPPSLLFAVPGQVLFGDYRYSELVLLVAGAALIGFSRRGVVPKLAASLLLTTPRGWFVIEQGWSEPIAVFMLALTIFLLVRNPIAAGWAGGVMAVTKQYLGFTGLSVLRIMLMRPRQWFWIGFGIAMSAAVVTLPIALWHPNAFMRNVVWLQTLEPFRADSLSYLAWAAQNGMGVGSFVWAVGAAIGAAMLSLVLTRNTAAGFAASVTLTTFAMFAFGSKAFCNYYFFVIGALCAAVAAIPLTSEQDSDSLQKTESRRHEEHEGHEIS